VLASVNIDINVKVKSASIERSGGQDRRDCHEEAHRHACCGAAVLRGEEGVRRHDVGIQQLHALPDVVSVAEHAAPPGAG
jgi:hypothetical protein